MQKYKLAAGSFTSINQRNVLSDAGVVVGYVQINRRSGWRGGPTYTFRANNEGVFRHLQDNIRSASVKELLSSISTSK